MIYSFTEFRNILHDFFVFIWLLLDLYKVLDSIFFRFPFWKAKLMPEKYSKLIQVFISLFQITLREKCPYSGFFGSVFSCFLNEYGEIRSISLYSVWIREDRDQKNSEYGHFSRSVSFSIIFQSFDTMAFDLWVKQMGKLMKNF